MASEAIRTGPVGWPERTLLPLVEAWAHKWLRQPDGPNAGEPWTFTEEQRRITAWWYAYDEHGDWLIRRGTLRRVKGWGKDPYGAVLCANELLGPCRIVRVGDTLKVRPNAAAWVQVAAVSRDQTRTTMRVFPALFSKEAVAKWKIDLNKEVIYAKSGQVVIEAITSSPRSAEGPRATFVLRNEIQNWLSTNDGHAMAEVIDGNLTKSRDGAARALSLCNAHVPGDDSVGEREWDAYQQIAQGRSRATGVMYDSLEAPADTKLDDEASLRHGLELARGDSVWLDIDRHVGEIWDPRTTPSEARRKYLNQIIAAEDAWVAPHQVDALLEPAPRPLQKSDMVALGFDGSKSDDNTGLSAVRIDDGASFQVASWDPS
ncbi:MAG: terminase, partial [Salinibacterium sp.]